MPINTKIGIVIYILLIIQGTASVTALYLKAKKTPVLYSLLACHFTLLLWLFLGILEDFSKYSEYLYVTIRFTLFPVYMIGPAFMIFALYYTGKIKEGKHKLWLPLLIVPSVICYLPVLTNDYFHLVIDETIRYEGVTRWGVLFYLNTGLSHLYFIVGSVLLIYTAIKEKKRIWQNAFFVVSVLFSALTNILTGLKIVESPGFDPVPITFSFVLAAISLLVFKYKIIDIVPLAYNELFKQINSAVLIVDRDGSIDEYNSVFTDYFDKAYDKCMVTNIYSFLEAISEYCDEKANIDRIKSFLNSKEELIHEDTIRLNSGDCMKQFTFSMVSLKTEKHSIIGKLIVIKDVTKYMEETLTDERDRLSGDLHDSLGNCINIISSNLEYAIKHCRCNSEIKECLEVSYEKATSAFLHLRRIVEELTPVDIENNGLLWALKSMFYKLRMKGINVEFSHSNVNDKLISERKHGEAIYYLCQEAMNNSVIHGKASNIIVTLIQKDNEIKLYITDDGIGCSEIVKNKGLNSMERRISALGGSLEYGSPSDGGFNIRAVLPFDNGRSV